MRVSLAPVVEGEALKCHWRRESWSERAALAWMRTRECAQALADEWAVRVAHGACCRHVAVHPRYSVATTTRGYTHRNPAAYTFPAHLRARIRTITKGWYPRRHPSCMPARRLWAASRRAATCTESRHSHGWKRKPLGSPLLRADRQQAQYYQHLSRRTTQRRGTAAPKSRSARSCHAEKLCGPGS